MNYSWMMFMVSIIVTLSYFFQEYIFCKINSLYRIFIFLKSQSEKEPVTLILPKNDMKKNAVFYLISTNL